MFLLWIISFSIPVEIDPAEVEEESIAVGRTGIVPARVCQLANHYGIFRDMFHQDSYFYPVVPLKVG